MKCTRVESKRGDLATVRTSISSDRDINKTKSVWVKSNVVELVREDEEEEEEEDEEGVGTSANGCERRLISIFSAA